MEPGPPVRSGRALLETEAGHARGERWGLPVKQRPAGHPCSWRCARGLVCSARGAPSPTASLAQACLPGRTRPLSIATQGLSTSLHGCASLHAPGRRRTPALLALQRAMRVMRVGGGCEQPGRSGPADRVRSTSSSYASNMTVSIYGPGYPFLKYRYNGCFD